MQTVLPSEFKRMMVLMLEGAPYVIEDSHTSGTAQTRHKLHTRLRQFKTGHVIERVFAENERVPVVQLETRRITNSDRKQRPAKFFPVQAPIAQSKGVVVPPILRTTRAVRERPGLFVPCVAGEQATIE